MRNIWILSFLILVYAGYPRLHRPPAENHEAARQARNALVVYKDRQVTDFFKRTRGAIAMDGGYSIVLSDHRVLWLFGDSYIDHYDSATATVPCLFQVRNSALLQPLGNWQWPQTATLLSKGPGARNFLKKGTDPNHFIWPAAGIQLKDTAYVFCNSMKNIPKGLGFDKGGPAMWAKIKLPEMEVVGYSVLRDFGNIGFGQGFIKDQTGSYVYVYGSRAKKGAIANQIYLARFPADDPDAGWTFWNGSGWDAKEDNIVPIGEVPGFSWHISKIKNKYLLLSAEFSLGCDQGKKIFASVSDHPAGPFSARKLIYTIDDTLQGHYPFFYGVMAHPEYINPQNELLVTYCINGYSPCIANCVNNRFDPERYRLRAIRVPLQLIDPSL